ncbi:CheR family methyltransferase [Adhaeribacter rhizoryzae]|uniref:protein-glutamate O-methyltransferase n=1 Tax=Adhaeribacter rhizoryzae TaxID=2607907 RepID=A0A5M6DM48_9BACT|nr:CheR family methyltransferase [Adhaeribacter rhizoryzae]KAA5548617.1 PAS domain S-box protein [Adhaeribacter rhizoryzae]
MSKKSNSSENNLNQDKPKFTLKDPYIIGIGASAGGLQAMDALFSNVPHDSVAYVIVQHLAPEHRSLLTQILNRHQQLNFREAEHDQLVEINNVYIIPSGKFLTIKNNRLQLTERSPDIAGGRTIDLFFKSLAMDKGPKAIGVILSGTGTDGTEGVLAIKKNKGLVLVQDPETAKFDGMPRNAINAGLIDKVLPPEMIPEAIFDFVKVSPLAKQMKEMQFSNDPSFLHILEIVRERTGFDFNNYKQPTLIRRISRRMAHCNIDSLANYVDYLNLNPEETETLSKEFLIGVTKFFRDPEAYDILAKEVIPPLAEALNLNNTLRIWVTACSTGEEAYSIAMLVREHLDTVKKEVEVKIFASDIDRDALDFAGAGLYPASSLSEVSEERRENFFTLEDGKYRVAPRIRRMVIFAQHNLINDPPFSRMDLVSCRNMLIYLSPVLQKKVLSKLHYALNVGGYLFLGPSESLGDFTKFTEVNKKWKIFQSTTASGSLGLENFMSPGTNFRKPDLNVPLRTRDFNPRQKLQHRLVEMLNDAILEEYAFAAVYLDENYDVIHGYGDYTKLVSLPERQLSFNILKLLPQDLALDLGALLRKAEQNKEKIVAHGLQYRDGDTMRHINIVIKPYLSDKKLFDRFILVLFSEDPEQAYTLNEPQLSRKEIHYETRVHELELELQLTREDLQSVVEELETANEELQSTNEELLSSNEELQSANEELQSLNEELNTINAEHQYKIKMLVELDDDLNNFFRSTDIGQIYVDSQLIIRKFTPAAMQQINLIEGDIGRSILQITHNIQHPDFINDILEAIKNTVAVEREVQDKNGIWYLLRILPYISQNRITDGAIILFININELKNMHLMQASILDSSPNAILALRAIRNNLNVIVDFECILLNSKAEEILKVKETDLRAKPLSKAYAPLLQNDLFTQYLKVVNDGEVLDIEQIQQLPGNADRWVHLIGVKLNDGLVLTMQNVTSRKNYQQQLLQQKAEIHANADRFRILLEAVPHITWTHHSSGENESFNQAWYDFTGFTKEESQGWGWTKAIHPDDLENYLAAYKEVLTNGKVLNIQARLLRQSDNQYRWHLVKAVPIRNNQSQISLWIGTATDIQDQKDAEEATIQLRLQQQKQILKAVLQTQEAERKRISEALHNGLGQLLYAAKLNLDHLENKNEAQQETKGRINNLLNQAISATRNISFELTPTVLRDFGLKTAIEELIRRLDSPALNVTSDLVGLEERFEDLIEISLYRIIQELLNNTMKHAEATTVHIELENRKNQLYLRVQDNGNGFNSAEKRNSKGIGLSSIRNRVKLLDGKLKIDSRPGQGTSVDIIIKSRPASVPAATDQD